MERYRWIGALGFVLSAAIAIVPLSFAWSWLALAETGYIDITKRFKDRMPNTSVRITIAGREALRNYRWQYSAFIERLDDVDRRR
jgi:hypothetical protein